MVDLVSIRRLVDEAWPEPWEKFGNTVTLKLKGGIVHTITLPGDHQTLEFIAGSRQLVPQMADEIERLRAAVRHILKMDVEGVIALPPRTLEMLAEWEEDAG